MGKISFKRLRQQPHHGRERQRFLNIIYFIDSNRTRSFKIPLRTAYWAGGLAAFVVLWSCFGTGVLVRESWLASQNANKTRYLLDALFQYQTRYDEVYEKAYTKDSSEPKIAAQDKNSQTTRKASTQSLAAKTLPEGKGELPAQAASNAADPEFPINLEGVKSRLRGNELQVSFDIRNNMKPSLATGNLWGVAKFVADLDQAVSYISSPINVPLDENGEAPEFRGGYAFSIRYFKARTMSFFAPSGVKGSFSEVRILLANDQGFKTSINIPINVRSNDKSNEGNAQIEQRILSRQVTPTAQDTATLPESYKANGSQTEGGNSLDAMPKRVKKSLTRPAETTNTNGTQSEPVKVSPASAPSAPSSIPKINGDALDSIDEDHPIDDEQVEENGN